MTSRGVLEECPEESCQMITEVYFAGAWHRLVWLAAWTAWANNLSR